MVLLPLPAIVKARVTAASRLALGTVATVG